MDRVRVFRQGREPIEVEVYRVVNVEQNPELREQALRQGLEPEHGAVELRRPSEVGHENERDLGVHTGSGHGQTLVR